MKERKNGMKKKNEVKKERKKEWNEKNEKKWLR